MRWTVDLYCAALLSVLTLLSSPAGAQDKIDIKFVKYTGLAETIKQHHGKVIVVDFWSDTCIPCKREFPRLVEMHKKYAKDNLAVVSVSLDDPADKQAMSNVLTFLKSRNATFTN